MLAPTPALKFIVSACRVNPPALSMSPCASKLNLPLAVTLPPSTIAPEPAVLSVKLPTLAALSVTAFASLIKTSPVVLTLILPVFV